MVSHQKLKHKATLNSVWKHIYILTEGTCLFQATEMQTRYMELLTMSGDYYRYLGELLKNMEELKVLL